MDFYGGAEGVQEVGEGAFGDEVGGFPSGSGNIIVVLKVKVRPLEGIAGVEPGFVGPGDVASFAAEDAGAADALDSLKAFFAGFEIEPGLEVGAGGEQLFLHRADVHGTDRAPAFHGKSCNHAGGLADFHHHRLQAGRPVDKIGHAYGLLRHDQVFNLERHERAHGQGERRDGREDHLRELCPIRVGVVVMIDRIIANGHAGTVGVSRIALAGLVQREKMLTLDTAAFAIVREQRKAVLRRILVSQAEILHTEAGLQEIQEADGALLRDRDHRIPLLARHIDYVGVEVVRLHGPVDHHLTAGQKAVGKHHPGRPQRLPLRDVLAVQRVLAAVDIETFVVVLRPGDRHVGILAVVFDRHDHGHVLDYAVTFFERHRFAGVQARVEADMVGHSARFRHIAQLSAVDEHLAAQGHTLTIGIVEADIPAFLKFMGMGECQPFDYLQLRLGRDHVFKNGLPHLRLEEHVAHPAGLQVFVAPVVLGQSIRELAEDAAAQTVVAVDCRDAGRGQHAAQPWGLFHYQCLRPHTRGLHSRRRPGRSSTNNKNIDTTVARHRANHRHRGQKYAFHIFHWLFLKYTIIPPTFLGRHNKKGGPGRVRLDFEGISRIST